MGQVWSYDDPTRIDTVAAWLAELRQWIQTLEGTVGKAEDDAAERARIAAEQQAKSQALFESLKKAVEEAKRK